MYLRDVRWLLKRRCMVTDHNRKNDFEFQKNIYCAKKKRILSKQEQTRHKLKNKTNCVIKLIIIKK